MTSHPQRLNIHIDDTYGPSAGWGADIPGHLEAVVRSVFKHVSPCMGTDDGYDLSIVLADNARVRELNATYRGKNKPTNVLSFENDQPPFPEEPVYLGDIIIAVPIILQEAKEQKKQPLDHLTHMVVHGVLHLYGLDHLSPEEAEIMENLEIRILNTLNIANPYEELERPT